MVMRSRRGGRGREEMSTRHLDATRKPASRPLGRPWRGNGQPTKDADQSGGDSRVVDRIGRTDLGWVSSNLSSENVWRVAENIVIFGMRSMLWQSWKVVGVVCAMVLVVTGGRDFMRRRSRGADVRDFKVNGRNRSLISKMATVQTEKNTEKKRFWHGRW